MAGAMRGGGVLVWAPGIASTYREEEQTNGVVPRAHDQRNAKGLLDDIAYPHGRTTPPCSATLPPTWTASLRRPTSPAVRTCCRLGQRRDGLALRLDPLVQVGERALGLLHGRADLEDVHHLRVRPEVLGDRRA